jgi:HAMP domain-containing protein
MPAIPLKDYLYAGAIAVLLIAFGLFIRHERSVGAAKVVAADQKAVAAQVERNAAVQTIANVATQLAQVKYENTIAAPIAHVSPVNCVRHNPLGSRPLPGAPSGAVSGDSAPIIGSANPSSAPAVSGPDLATALVTIGRDDDAKIKALQQIVATLRKEMEKSNGK